MSILCSVSWCVRRACRKIVPATDKPLKGASSTLFFSILHLLRKSREMCKKMVESCFDLIQFQKNKK
jgi:hypothetical protein